jgi:hypothetical protein
MDQVGGNPQLDTSMLPTFREYKQLNETWSPGLDIWNFLNARADIELAASFTKLFWPDFIEVEGCVLLKRAYSPEAFHDWLERYGGDTRAVEALLNHVHIKDLFLNPPKGKEHSEQLYEYLAEALIFGWKQILTSSYPDKQFVFTLRHGYGPEISFHQAESLITA